MKVRSWLAAGLLAWAWGVQAAGYAVVDAVQAPAWVERGEARLALSPGMELRNRDRLVTGVGARALIQLSDGSTVKLGSDTQLSVNALGQREGKVFTAALDMVTGAFRLTTDLFRKYQTRRAINVRAGTVTAGIRGTDIWGKSDSESDLICLLEGRITVSHPEGEAALLNEPLQYYGATKGQAPGPVASIDGAQAAEWAAQTELQAGMGVMRQGGHWAVSLATVDTEAEALAMYDRAQILGYAAKIRPQRAENGLYRYELRLTRIPDEAEARALAAQLGRKLETGAPRIFRY